MLKSSSTAIIVEQWQGDYLYSCCTEILLVSLVSLLACSLLPPRPPLLLSSLLAGIACSTATWRCLESARRTLRTVQVREMCTRAKRAVMSYGVMISNEMMMNNKLLEMT
eukprot:768656-Hanusia_phi.AAC.6